MEGRRELIAGINHMAWLLEITRDGKDLYPEIKRRALHPELYDIKNDLVRLDMMKNFGFYITESSEHGSEYLPWYIKSKYPELIERFNIPLDEPAVHADLLLGVSLILFEEKGPDFFLHPLEPSEREE